MGEYLYTLTGACVLIALICAVVPSATQKHAKLLCGLCLLCLVCYPIISMIRSQPEQDWEIPDAWLEPEPEEQEQNREQIAQNLLSGQLQLLLEQEFGLGADVCRIYAEWSEDGRVSHVTLVLSGKAIWEDPAPISQYVQQLFGCPCTVVLD